MSEKGELTNRCDDWMAALPEGEYACQKPRPENDDASFEEPRDLTAAQFAVHMRAMARLPKLRPGDDEGRGEREHVIESSICRLVPKTTKPKQTWRQYCEKEVARRNAAGGIAKIGTVELDGVTWCAVVATGLVFRRG
jgi:hypothetical protein